MSMITLSTASAKDIVKKLPNLGVGFVTFALSTEDAHLYGDLIDTLTPQIAHGTHVTVEFGGGSLEAQQELQRRAEEAAFRRLQTFSKRVTKALCLAQAEHPYKLHPHITDVERAVAGHLASSRMLVTIGEAAPPHVDRGLFNLVVGTASDLSSLQVEINGNWTGTARFLPADDQLYAVMIPGLTLHYLYPQKFAPVAHRVTVAPPGPNGTFQPCTMIVFQWRLDSSIQIPLQNVLSQVPSFRGNAQAAAVPPAQPATALSAEGGSFTFNRAIQRWEGVPIFDQKLVFNGFRLLDHSMLASHGIAHGDTVDLLLEQFGD